MKTKTFLLLSMLLSSLCFSQRQDITKYLLENNPDKILKLLSSYEIIYSEKRDAGLHLAYETEMPVTLFNQQIKPLRWEVKNGKLYALIGTIEEFDKDISDHPEFGISNYRSDSRTTEEEAVDRKKMIMRRGGYMNDNSPKKQALDKNFTSHFSSYKEDVMGCQFDCFAVWKTDFGWITIEKNNFSEKINDEVILSIKNMVAIFFDKDMDPDSMFGSDDSSESAMVEEATPVLEELIITEEGATAPADDAAPEAAAEEIDIE